MLSLKETIRRFVEADVKRNLPKMPAEVRLGCLCPAGRVLAPGGGPQQPWDCESPLGPRMAARPRAGAGSWI